MSNQSVLHQLIERAVEKEPVESVSQPKVVDGYLKEFDERFKPCYIGQVGEGGAEVSSYIKDFIRSSIESARREERVKIGENKRIAYQLGVAEERQRVVEMIEGLDRWDEVGEDINGDYVLLSDLQSKLGDNHAK